MNTASLLCEFVHVVCNYIGHENTCHNTCIYIASLLYNFVHLACKLLSGYSTYRYVSMYTASPLCDFLHAPCKLIIGQSTQRNCCIPVPSLVSSLPYSSRLIAVNFMPIYVQFPLSPANLDIELDFLSRHLVNCAVKMDVLCPTLLTKWQRKYHIRRNLKRTLTSHTLVGNYEILLNSKIFEC